MDQEHITLISQIKEILDKFDDDYVHKNNIEFAKTTFNLIVVPISSKPEIWLPLKHKLIVDDRYLISSWGRVFDNINNHYPTPALCDKGYIRVSLLKKDNNNTAIRIHSLVASTFIPNPLNKETVNHIDFNKQNNTIENLEWLTNEENLKHANDNNRRLNTLAKEILTPDEVKNIRLKAKEGFRKDNPKTYKNHKKFKT